MRNLRIRNLQRELEEFQRKMRSAGGRNAAVTQGLPRSVTAGGLSQEGVFDCSDDVEVTMEEIQVLTKSVTQSF